jgi:tellurite methyltransferase
MESKIHAKWNQRYQKKGGVSKPAAILRRFAHLATPGRALDIAAGSGGNAIFLSRNGFAVDALDISDVALARLVRRHPQIRAACVDLTCFDIPAGHYDLICNLRYLERRLFPYIIEALRPGGILIFETYMEGKGEVIDPPTQRDYLLRPGELLRSFFCLHVLYYEERPNRPPYKSSHTASLVARKH